MRIRQVDPRDAVWEKDQHSYRVYFKKSDDERCHDMRQATDEWEINDADLGQVLAWVADNSEGRSYTLYAYITNEQGPGLLRLLTTEAAS